MFTRFLFSGLLFLFIPPAFAGDTLSTPRLVGPVKFSGNKITKEYILRRELTFHTGDTISQDALTKKFARSRENLLNTSLFNFVTIRDSLHSDSLTVSVHIEVKERWYTWPVPIFEIVEQNVNTWWNNGHNLERANYGMLVTRYNFRGRKESVGIALRFGYSERLGVSYNMPFLNKKQTIGAGFSVSYTRNHEVAYRTQNNILQFYKNHNKYLREEFYSRFYLSYRPNLYITHIGDIRFTNTLVNDTIRELNPDYYPNQETRMEYFAASYRFACDHRDLKAYPKAGWFFDAEVAQLGFGLLPKEGLSVTNFYGSFRRYYKIGKKFSWAGSLRGKFSPSRNQPYYVQRAFGFGLYVRGYEYYMIDGQSFALAKTQFRYEIIKPQVRKIKFLPIEKFNTFHIALYGSVFADAGYTDDRFSDPVLNNRLCNDYLFGTGAGLDFVTYYDIVLRAEYSFNKLGESGFFLHLGAPL